MSSSHLHILSQVILLTSFLLSVFPSVLLFFFPALLLSSLFSLLSSLVSSLLFPDSSHLCFSSIHIGGNLTCKLPWIFEFKIRKPSTPKKALERKKVNNFLLAHIYFSRSISFTHSCIYLFMYLYVFVFYFPDCVARVPVSLWGSGGGSVFTGHWTLRNHSQLSATVRMRTVWPCLL